MIDLIEFKTIITAEKKEYLTNYITSKLFRFNRLEGNFQGFHLTIYENNLMICRGSLTKFYLKSNCYNMNFAQVKEAIIKLNDVFNIDLNAAEVTSLEFGYNFELNVMPNKIMDCMGRCEGYKQGSEGNGETIYYRNRVKNTTKVLIFYDKIKESRTKFPEEFKNKNIIRYELKFPKALKKTFKRTITISDLCDYDFINNLLQIYKQEFSKIAILKVDSIPNYNNYSSLKDASLVYMISKIGIERMQRDIASKFKSGLISKANYQKLKTEIKSLIVEKSNDNTDFIKDLKSKIASLKI